MRGMLRKLTDTSRDVLAGFDTGECSTQLKAKLHIHNIFLAIGNVSDSVEVIEQAKKYLRAGFKQDSVIIVTARSLEQLECVGITKNVCLEMQKLDACEARALVLEPSAGVPDESNEEDEDCVMRCVKLCRFLKGYQSRFDYLPLALKMLGLQLGSGGYNPKLRVVMVEQEPETFNQLRERENPIFNTIFANLGKSLSQNRFWG